MLSGIHLTAKYIRTTYIHCLQCGGSTAYFTDINSAIKAWNTRSVAAREVSEEEILKTIRSWWHKEIADDYWLATDRQDERIILAKAIYNLVNGGGVK